MSEAATRRALVVIRLEDDVVLSRRSATAGDHQTLDYIPGAALLGWAARQYGSYYDPFAVFHSGRVRFSNALPVRRRSKKHESESPGQQPVQEGGVWAVGYPLPKVLVAPKGAPAEDGRPPKDTMVGRPRSDDQEKNDKQLDAVKGRWIATSGDVVSPTVGRSLRTSTKNGRAATGELFGYTHLERGQLFAAMIEADAAAASGEDWDRLLARFGGAGEAVIQLGRSKQTEYGRAAALCEELSPGDASIWPAPEPREPSPATGGAKGSQAEGGENRVVVVWLLSDVALVDAWGAPNLRPKLSDLFPSAQAEAELDLARSAAPARRWAPWNSHLGTRDAERVVLEAGSVLVYRDVETWEPPADTAPVGLWTEQGLGRVWVDPPMLGEVKGERLVDLIETDRAKRAATTLAAAAALLETLAPEVGAPADHGDAGSSEHREHGESLAGWATRRAALLDTKLRDKWVAERRRELCKLYESAQKRGLKGPSRAHWNAIAALARTCADPDDLLGKLDPVIGPGPSDPRPTPEAKKETWGKPDEDSFAKWLRSTLSATVVVRRGPRRADETPGALDPAHFREAMHTLAKAGVERASKRKEGATP